MRDAALAPTGMLAHSVKRFAEALRERFGERVFEILLFGSRARGEAHEDSDVDILVVIDELSEFERLAILDLAYATDAAAPQWMGLSPLVYSSAQAASMRSGGRRLFRDIDSQGIRL